MGLKGYGLHLGAAAPLGAGTLTAGLYFVDFSEEYAGNEADSDYKYYGVSARYNYPLSTRTVRPRVMLQKVTSLITKLRLLRFTAASFTRSNPSNLA